EGIALMLEGLGGYRATGAELERSVWIALLAEAYGLAGRPREGLSALEEGLADVEKTSIRCHQPELLRLRGELLLRLGPSRQEDAVACFQLALDTARQHDARSLELRAAISLGRLWAQQGKREEACRVVTDVYGWFTEGFDTGDLRAARTLLAQL